MTDITEEQLDIIIAQKEEYKALRREIKALNMSELNTLVRASNGAFADFVEKLKEIAKQEPPNVNVVNNNTEVVAALSGIADKIIASNMALQESVERLIEMKKVPWKLDIKYYGEEIQSVTAKPIINDKG